MHPPSIQKHTQKFMTVCFVLSIIEACLPFDFKVLVANQPQSFTHHLRLASRNVPTDFSPCAAGRPVMIFITFLANCLLSQCNSAFKMCIFQSMGGWPASNDFHHFPSKLLIVSLQLSIQKCADADRGDDDASADCTTLQHDIYVFTSSCPWVSNQADGASCLVATDTPNHLATCKGEGLWGHLNFLGFSSNLDHKMTIRLLELLL